ncbi:MAG: GNAT family N-acetyltransferase [Micromonosporaceae bacterium]
MPAEQVRPAVEPVQVRSATVADDAALLAIEVTSWPPGSGFPSYLAEQQRRTSFFGETNTPEDVMVAEYQGSVVGHIKVRQPYPMPEGAHLFAIHGLVVAEHARGNGVGGALLRAAEHRVRGHGGRKLKLNVFGTNPTAQRLYERHGYVVEGRYAGEFFIDGEYIDDIAMSKPLD